MTFLMVVIVTIILAPAFDRAVQYQIQLVYGGVTDGKRPTKYQLNIRNMLVLFAAIAFAYWGSVDHRHLELLAAASFGCSILYMARASYLAIQLMQNSHG